MEADSMIGYKVNERFRRLPIGIKSIVMTALFFAVVRPAAALPMSGELFPFSVSSRVTTREA